jgi:tetratricopeptide (TPR) repeat protein
MIRLSTMLLGTVILTAHAEVHPLYDYSLAKPIHFCTRLQQDVTVTALDVAVVIQACGEALADSGAEWSVTRARVLTGRASAYKVIGEYHRAIADLNEAIQLLLFKRRETSQELGETLEHIHESLVRAFSDRNDVYRAKQEYDRAIADIGKIIRIDLHEIAAFKKIGLLYWRGKKDYDRAIANLSNWIGHGDIGPSEPGFAVMFYQRANAYGVIGQADSAIADYSQAIRINPTNYLAFINRGMTYAIYKDDYDRAIADFDEAIGRQPKQAYALTCRALAHKAKGASDLASADLEAAERINPEVKKIAERQWQLATDPNNR